MTSEQRSRKAFEKYMREKSCDYPDLTRYDISESHKSGMYVDIGVHDLWGDWCEAWEQCEKGRKMKLKHYIMIAYWIAAMFTYGHALRMYRFENTMTCASTDFCVDHSRSNAIAASVFWPLHWSEYFWGNV